MQARRNRLALARPCRVLSHPSARGHRFCDPEQLDAVEVRNGLEEEQLVGGVQYLILGHFEDETSATRRATTTRGGSAWRSSTPSSPTSSTPLSTRGSATAPAYGTSFGRAHVSDRLPRVAGTCKYRVLLVTG